MSGNEKLIKKNAQKTQLKKPKSLSGSTPTQPKTASKKHRSSSLSESDASSISSQLELNVTPQAAMPAIQHSHRDKDKCPCNQSLESSWKLDCAKCGQFWHANCVGLNGLNRKMLNDLTQWPCPFCFVSPIATISTEVEVCHVCRNTLSLQQTNLELETAHISAHLEPLANCCKLIKDIDFVEFGKSIDTLGQFDQRLKHLLLNDQSLKSLDSNMKLLSDQLATSLEQPSAPPLNSTIENLTAALQTHDKTFHSVTNQLNELKQQVTSLSSDMTTSPTSEQSDKLLERVSQELREVCKQELKQSTANLQHSSEHPSTPPGQQELPRSPEPPHQEEIPSDPNESPVNRATEEFISVEEQEVLLLACQSVEFTQEGSHAVCSLGEPYKYNGSRSPNNQLTTTTTIPNGFSYLVERINDAYCSGDKPKINSLLINRFKEEDGSLAAHSDDEPTIHPESEIYTVSIGGQCKIKFSDSKSGEVVLEHECNARSMYSMTRRSQHHFRHCIEEGAITGGMRYSLTFRSVSFRNKNATCIIGDSNTGGLKFGTDARKSFGQWFPGRQYFAPVVDQIDPYVTCGYRNVVLMCAINDLKKPEIKNTADIKQNVFIPFIKKIEKIQAVNPRAHVYVCPALPTKLAELNRKVVCFNRFIFTELIPSNFGVTFVDGFGGFCDDAGLLSQQFSRNLGRSQRPDYLHLNWRGTAKLGTLIRNTVLIRMNGGVDRRKKRSDEVDGRSYSNVLVPGGTGSTAAESGHQDGYQPF